MCVWTERKYSLSIAAVLWVWVLAPSPFRPSSPDALRPTHGTAIYTEPSVNGVTFHRALRGIIRCPQVPREAHALMICLLDAANDNAEVWLSQQQIRERTGYAIRTIREWMGRMVRLGFLDPIYPGGRSKSGQKRWASRFRINVESLSEYDTQPASACRSRGAHDRQVPAAQPATAGSATGECLPHDRQQVAPYRLKTDLDRLKTEEENGFSFPAFLAGDPSDGEPEPIMAALYALHPRGAAGMPGTWTTKARQHADEYGIERVLEALQWAKDRRKSLADALARVRQQTWDAAKKGDPEETPQFSSAEIDALFDGKGEGE